MLCVWTKLIRKAEVSRWSVIMVSNGLCAWQWIELYQMNMASCIGCIKCKLEVWYQDYGCLVDFISSYYFLKPLHYNRGQHGSKRGGLEGNPGKSFGWMRTLFYWYSQLSFDYKEISWLVFAYQQLLKIFTVYNVTYHANWFVFRYKKKRLWVAFDLWKLGKNKTVAKLLPFSTFLSHLTLITLSVTQQQFPLMCKIRIVILIVCLIFLLRNICLRNKIKKHDLI